MYLPFLLREGRMPFPLPPSQEGPTQAGLSSYSKCGHKCEHYLDQPKVAAGPPRPHVDSMEQEAAIAQRIEPEWERGYAVGGRWERGEAADLDL